MISRTTAAAPIELGLDPIQATDALFVVGLTLEGHVPLSVEAHPGAPVIVRLPGLTAFRPLEALSSMHQRLRDEAGVDADELVVMSRYGIPTGERGRATILLAPHARVFPESNPAMRVVPVSELTRWLERCRNEGIRVDPRVWVGLLLAERHFPRWAQTRLRAAIETLSRQGPEPAGVRQ